MNLHDRMDGVADLYVAGGLAPEERSEIEAHVSACGGCALMLKDAREFSAWARGAIAPDAPPRDLEDRLVARFRGTMKTKRRIPVGKRFLKVTGSLAAAVGLVCLGNLFSDRFSAEGANPGEPSFALTTLSSAEHDFSGTDREWRAQTKGEVDLVTRSNKNDRRESESLKGFGMKPDALAAKLGVLQQAASQDDKAGARGFVEGQRLSDLKDGENSAKAAGPLGKNGGTTGGLAGKEFTPLALVPQDNRKIIRTADVSLEVDSYESTLAKLTDLVAAEKGMIAGSSVQKLANGKIRATVTLRIPPESFASVLAKVGALGTVRNQDVGSQDVTKAYVDLESRLKSKETLVERLRKLLSEGKGTVKELMEVEVQMGAAIEALEQIKGEIKYYDNQVGLSTITLRVSEKDLGQPFEFVQTLQSTLSIAAREPDEAYTKAQKEIIEAGGQVIEARMTRDKEGSSTGILRGRVEADKFPALRESLKRLGNVTNDTVNQQKSARGGHEGMIKSDAPLRKELAVVDLTITSPPVFVTRRSQLLIETDAVESAYQNARRAIEAAGGKIQDGSFTGASGGTRATLKAQVDADKFTALVESLKTAGKVRNSTVNQILPAASTEGAPPLLRERAELDLELASPPQLIGEEHGILKTLRETLAASWAGILWSLEKLFVGLSLAGPWIAVGAGLWFLWRRLRRRKAAEA